MQRPDDKPAPHPGTIRPEECYRFDEAAARLGWSESRLRAASREGLRIYRAGTWCYVLGRDLLTFITREDRDAP